jgi:hypothetical protein
MSLLRIRQQGIDFSDNSRMTSLFEIIAQNSRMFFQSSAAPTNWTKVTSSAYNNAALRIVSQSTFNGTTTSGRVSFTQAFKTHSTQLTNIQGQAQGLSVGNHTLTTPQIPQHSHSVPRGDGNRGVSGNTPSNQTTAANPTSTNTGQKGGGGQHSHPVACPNVKSTTSFSHNVSVRYVDLILCTFQGNTTSSGGGSDSGS